MLFPTKDLAWIGDAKAAYDRFPPAVKKAFGYALYLAQIGRFPVGAKALKGFGNAKVVELSREFAGNAYRVVYSVHLERAICVLHCFQKKSKKGSAMDASDLATIKRKLGEILKEAD